MEKMAKVMDTLLAVSGKVPIVQEGYRQCGHGGCPERFGILGDFTVLRP